LGRSGQGPGGVLAGRPPGRGANDLDGPPASAASSRNDCGKCCSPVDTAQMPVRAQGRCRDAGRPGSGPCRNRAEEIRAGLASGAAGPSCSRVRSNRRVSPGLRGERRARRLSSSRPADAVGEAAALELKPGHRRIHRPAPARAWIRDGLRPPRCGPRARELGVLQQRGLYSPEVAKPMILDPPRRPTVTSWGAGDVHVAPPPVASRMYISRRPRA